MTPALQPYIGPSETGPLSRSLTGRTTFNPTLVLLKPRRTLPGRRRCRSFNPTLVLLKRMRVRADRHARDLQPYIGPSETVHTEQRDTLKHHLQPYIGPSETHQPPPPLGRYTILQPYIGPSETQRLRVSRRLLVPLQPYIGPSETVAHASTAVSGNLQPYIGPSETVGHGSSRLSPLSFNPTLVLLKQHAEQTADIVETPSTLHWSF